MPLLLLQAASTRSHGLACLPSLDLCPAAALQEQDEEAGEQASESTPGAQPPGDSEPSLAPSGGSAAGVRAQQAQQEHRDQVQQRSVETSARSAGHLGSRPAQAAPRTTTAPSYRPAAIHSARGAEYYNRPPTSTRSAGNSDSSGSGGWGGPGSTASTGALTAHNRLYADHFRKQKRLEEERRLR